MTAAISRRQVGVVVDERGPAVDAADVEPAGDAAEAGRGRWRTPSNGTPSAAGHGDRAGGVDDVVHAAQRQREPRRAARRACSTANVNEPPPRAHVDGADVGALGEAVGDRVVARRPARRTPGRRRTRTFGPGDLGEVAVEAVDEGVERAVVLEEVELDVGAGSCRAAAARGGCRRSRRPRRRATRRRSSGRRCRRR